MLQSNTVSVLWGQQLTSWCQREAKFEMSWPQAFEDLALQLVTCLLILGSSQSPWSVTVVLPAAHASYSLEPHVLGLAL
jgi:hypothetical protein